jgi:hypothetical protein
MDTSFTRRNHWINRLLKIIPVVLTLLLISHFLVAQEGEATKESEEQANYPSLNPTGFLQTHFSADDMSGNPAGFSIHRARFGFKGNLSENIQLNLVIGATEPPNNTPALVNAFTDFTLDPAFNLRAGQFFAPFGLEGPEPITQNPAIERAFSTRSMNPFRMFRDIGVMAYGKLGAFRYDVAILNGSGANVAENFNPKDVVARVEYAPLENLKAGISAHLETYTSVTFSNLSRQRWGLHAVYNQSPLLLRGEFFLRNREVVPDNHQQSTGAYLLGKYDISEKWGAVARYDLFSPEGGGDSYQGFTLGPNYQVGPKTQLSLNGIFYTPVNQEDMHSALSVQLQMVL